MLASLFQLLVATDVKPLVCKNKPVNVLPGGKPLDEITQVDLDDIADEINNRPMKCLNFKTPYEVLLANVALRN